METELRREQIGQAAMDIVAIHGVRGLTNKRVAKVVGIVPSALYKHFKSKDHTVMLMAAFVVFGVFSYRGLGLDQMPKVSIPVACIFATLPGTSPEELETKVAKPIEAADNALGGVDQITTKCTFGMVQVAVQFVLEKDIAIAAQEVRDKISQIQRSFPDGTPSS